MAVKWRENMVSFCWS